MKTLQQFKTHPEFIPASAAWYLSDLGEAKGKQTLFTKQAPQKLNVLREHALIESAVSSSRIEGVEIDQSRIGTVIFGKPVLQDRDEEEVRGYRDALNQIHQKNTKLPVSEEMVKEFHRLVKGHIWDAGQYREKESDIVEKYPDGRSRIRFKTVKPTDINSFMSQLLSYWTRCLKERWIHPLIAVAACNLDFLCIHPFRDGNGRVSRLLFLLQCYYLGYDVGRYISIERVIEQNKERYYETLEMSSQGWHQRNHNPWHFINFMLSILKISYREFEERLEQIKSPRGAKTELIITAIKQTSEPFSVGDIHRQCPGISLDLIRLVLKKLRSDGKVECLGRGQNAKWDKTEPWEIGTT